MEAHNTPLFLCIIIIFLSFLKFIFHKKQKYTQKYTFLVFVSFFRVFFFLETKKKNIQISSPPPLIIRSLSFPKKNRAIFNVAILFLI